MYAFLTDGLDDEKREELDVLLEGKASKTKIRRERAAAEAAMREMR